MRIQDQWWCSCGENPHCSLTKKTSALRLCMSVMLGKSSHHEKIGSLWPLLIFSKKYPPLPLPIFFQKSCPSPLGQCLNESYLYFRWLPRIESCWGQGISWTKRKFDGLGLIIPLTEGRYDLVMYRIGRRKNEDGGILFVEKFKNGGRDPIFFMVGTLTQHAWHAKSQSAATFC